MYAPAYLDYLFPMFISYEIHTIFAETLRISGMAIQFRWGHFYLTQFTHVQKM